MTQQQTFETLTAKLLGSTNEVTPESALDGELAIRFVDAVCRPFLSRRQLLMAIRSFGRDNHLDVKFLETMK